MMRMTLGFSYARQIDLIGKSMKFFLLKVSKVKSPTKTFFMTICATFFLKKKYKLMFLSSSPTLAPL